MQLLPPDLQMPPAHDLLMLWQHHVPRKQKPSIHTCGTFTSFLMYRDCASFGSARNVVNSRQHRGKKITLDLETIGNYFFFFWLLSKNTSKRCPTSPIERVKGLVGLRELGVKVE